MIQKTANKRKKNLKVHNTFFELGGEIPKQEKDGKLFCQGIFISGTICMHFAR